MDKALLDFEVSIDADCKLLTVGKPFAIEGTQSDSHTVVFTFYWLGLSDNVVLGLFLKHRNLCCSRTFIATDQSHCRDFIVLQLVLVMFQEHRNLCCSRNRVQSSHLKQVVLDEWLKHRTLSQ